MNEIYLHFNGMHEVDIWHTASLKYDKKALHAPDIQQNEFLMDVCTF